MYEYQRPQTGARGHEVEQFRAMVVATCQQEYAKAIAEEMSIEALEKHGVHQSICQQVADALHIKHWYCDPSTQERKELGIVDEDSIYLAGRFANRALEQIEVDIRASWAIRERRWFEHLLELEAWPVLFICGANHAETFRTLLEDNDIVVHMLFERWVPQ